MSKKIKISFLISMLLFLLFAAGFILSSDLGLIIKKEFNENFLSKEQLPDLSTEKMEKEFDHIFDVLSSSCSEAINGNGLTGIYFAEKGDIYRTRIRQAGSNIEYFYVLKALTSDLKSCHTEILYPDITEYPSYINGFAASVDQAVYRYSDYWINELSECVNSYDGDVVGFDYCSGSYINADTENDKIYYLKEIDGTPVDEFILNNISIWKINYDFIADKPFRNSVVFDNNDGQKKVGLLIEDNFGNDTEQTAFINWQSEIAVGYSFLSDESRQNKQNCNFYFFSDTQRDLCYIRLDEMNGEGSELETAVSSITDDTKNIILDLRRNPGGYISFARENVYPPIFSRSAYIETTSAVVKSKYNKKIFDNRFDSNNMGELTVVSGSETEKIYSVSANYTGNSAHSCNVFILVSHNTASAADELTAAAKYCKTAVIIGENTGGEGIGLNSSVIIPLKTSGLYLRYNAAASDNPDGSINSIYGTSPDHYQELTEDGYFTCRKELALGNDPYEYENRLKWDDVLIKAIEIIEEKENAG